MLDLSYSRLVVPTSPSDSVVDAIELFMVGLICSPQSLSNTVHISDALLDRLWRTRQDFVIDAEWLGWS